VTPSTAPDPSVTPLPADVLEALEQGQTIEAIKRLRSATGLGLKEAKEAIDRHLAGEPARVRPRPSIAAMAALPFAVASALRKGDKMEAIRLMREQGGLGLKAAKDAVEAYGREQGADDYRRAPGEVPRRGGAGWLVFVLVVVALALLARRLFADAG
jgi:ribosomal protein L7/L12